MTTQNVRLDRSLAEKFKILCAVEGVAMTVKLAALVKAEIEKNTHKLPPAA